METEYKKQKKSSKILKKLERYLSIPNKKANEKRQVAPMGCFSVYVGPHKQRFVIKTEFANHPLFKILLEDAELEYGFKNEGPLLLPCEVDLFCKVLAEMDHYNCYNYTDFDDEHDIHQPCGLSYGGSCSPFMNPGRRLGKIGMAKGCSSYRLHNAPRLLKINHF